MLSEERIGVRTSKLVCGVIFVLSEKRNGVQTSKLVCGVIFVLSEERKWCTNLKACLWSNFCVE